VITVPDFQVDKVAAELTRRVRDRRFDDEHLVAIVAVSGCRVVCSDDRMAHHYLKLRHLYPSGVRPPKIYRNVKHVRLCVDSNVAPICRCSK
jgi:hypothetical protein